MCMCCGEACVEAPHMAQHDAGQESVARTAEVVPWDLESWISQLDSSVFFSSSPSL